MSYGEGRVRHGCVLNACALHDGGLRVAKETPSFRVPDGIRFWILTHSCAKYRTSVGRILTSFFQSSLCSTT